VPRTRRGDPRLVASVTTLSPVDDDGTGSGSAESEEPDEHDRGYRGWVSPDDRLWRHPSEFALAASVAPGPRSPSRRRGSATTHRRHSPWITGSATACAAGALVVTGIVLASTTVSPRANGRGAGATPVPAAAMVSSSPVTEPGTVQLASHDEIDRVMSTVLPSLVVLTVNGPSGTTTTTGVVVESGGIIATTAAAVGGATSISAVEASGLREHADLIGVDQTSDIAVVRVMSDLPSAAFDPIDPDPTGTAMALAFDVGSRSGSPFSCSVYEGVVLSSGTSLGAGGPTNLFATTAVRTPLTNHDLGSPLVDDNGHVSGILEHTMSERGADVAVFLPAELVLGVTRQLVMSGEVEPGRLGIDGSDTSVPNTSGTTPIGALVDSVDVGSAAASVGLRVGDTIVGIDGEQVHSMSELRTRLYSITAGTSLDVSFERAGLTLSTTVILGVQSGDASGF
jgi:S1-C subfamily serine protease